MEKPYYRVWANFGKVGWSMEDVIYSEPVGRAQEHAKRLANKLHLETAVCRHWRSSSPNHYLDQRDFFVQKFQPNEEKQK